ncbi:MAG: flagellar biosynthetic protein FliR [Planctomycetota bacterium]
MNSLVLILLIFTRLTAMVLTAPMLGSRNIPFRFRMGVSLILTISTYGLTVQPHVDPIEFMPLLFSEAAIGLMLGLGIMIIFVAAKMAGTVISQMSGIQLAGNLDPGTGQPSTALGQFFSILSLAAFVAAGGPELLITATIDSFQRLPVGTSIEFSGLAKTIPVLLQQSFTLTLRGVAPAVAAMLISTVVVAWVNRSFPQMNLFSVGLSSNLVVMFLAVGLTMSGCVWLFVDDLQSFVRFIVDTLQSIQAPVLGGAN